MNREIKFRVWNKVRKDLLYDMIPFRGNKIFQDENMVVMQFTGLKDKNGKEIYEGDIMYVAGVGNCVVKFNYGAFGLTREDMDNVWEYFNEDFEGDIDMKVLGNIYENPKLLEDLE